MTEGCVVVKGIKETTGSVVAIAGGTRNIGLEIARSVLASGGKVAVCGSSESQAEIARKELGSPDRCVVSVVDVGDPAAVAAWGEDWKQLGQPVEALVFAAVQRVHETVEGFTAELWQSSIAVSLSGAFYCVQAFMRQAPAPPSGSIVLVGGRSAHRGAAHRSSVVAAKAGLVGLARGLALELADRRIRTNVVVPGRIQTERGAWTSLGDAKMIADHYASDIQPQDAPLGPGFPEDVVRVVQFLMGEDSRYVTGQVLHVNGGTHL